MVNDISVCYKNKNVWAHISENKKPETIMEHSKRTFDIYKKTKLFQALTNIINNELFEKYFWETSCLSENSQTALKIYVLKLLNYVFYIHDVGKGSNGFQSIKMQNPDFDKKNNIYSNHSAIGAFIYLASTLDNIQLFAESLEYNTTERKKAGKIKIVIEVLNTLVFSLATVILTHHTSLRNVWTRKTLEHTREVVINEDAKRALSNFEWANISNYSIVDTDEKIKSIFENRNNREVVLQNHLKGYSVYMLIRGASSALRYCDHLATHEYTNADEEKTKKLISNSNRKNKIKKLKSDFYNSSQIKSILSKKKPNSEINELRNQIFFITDENANKAINNNVKIMYLKAPCGAGKTNCIVNISLKTGKPIYYVAPLNTISSQNKEKFSQFTTTNDDVENGELGCCGFINSQEAILSPDVLNTISEDSAETIKDIVLHHSYLDFALTTISSVKLGDLLWGTSGSNIMLMERLIGSVIVIDEIQLLAADIWPKFANMLYVYARLFDITFVLSSATLPPIHLLVDEKYSI